MVWQFDERMCTGEQGRGGDVVWVQIVSQVLLRRGQSTEDKAKCSGSLTSACVQGSFEGWWEGDGEVRVGGKNGQKSERWRVQGATRAW